MKITAQLPWVNRPLSVELRLIDFCSCDFRFTGRKSHRAWPIAIDQTVRLSQRRRTGPMQSFRRGSNSVRRQSWGRQFSKKKGNNGAKTPDSGATKEYLSC